MKKRTLTPEEEKLWQLVTRNDVRISHGYLDAPPVPLRSKSVRISASLPVFTSQEMNLPPASMGSYANIDRNTADRFRKGEYPLDGTLDLHGMSREKAHKMLSTFMHTHWERGSRCLLVVTGKGIKKDLHADTDRGILREMLPGWLSEPGLKPMVLAFDQAQQKHGGSGAYYILLRRKRG